MVFAQIFIGFGAYASLTISYIIMSDLFDDKLRQVGIITVNAAWGLGEVSFYLLYNFLPNWQYFTIGCLLVPLVGWFIIAYFLLI
jgi:ABC-type cobalamin transport system permease subunit